MADPNEVESLARAASTASAASAVGHVPTMHVSPVDDPNNHASPVHGLEATATLTAGLEETFVLPASREQTRYWMLAQLDPSSTASNMAIAFDISGDMNAAAAEAAIAALTMRHEALRTIFRLEAGVLSQVILSRPLYSFETEDLSAFAESSRDEAAQASVSRHGHTVIDLHSGPVLHARLIQLSRQKHILALTMNHIVCDGWSNGILIRDFTLLYDAILTNKEAVLPELPFQFADFALWQHEYLESPEAEMAANFWKSRVTADLPALDLPTDYPRTAGRSFPGHIESALLPQTTNDRLIEFCRNSGSTKHIVLLAAFEALCARYTGQTEFLLGSTIANRTQPGMENVVGRFANPQIIVARVEGDPTFAGLEQAVRESGTEAYNHQDLPFSRIIEDFQMTQAGATSQFLQVWFLYQKAFMQPQTGSTILVTPRRSVSGGVDFDLLVSIVERAEGPRIQMEYNTQLFSTGRIRRLIEGFIELLGNALEYPDRPLSTIAGLPAVSAAPEAPAALVAIRKPAAKQRLFDQLSAMAVKLPDAVAVAEPSHSVSWAGLDAQSSAVAAELKRREITSSSLVLVHLSETAASVVALVGALKTGAKVLPLPWHGTSDSIHTLLTLMPGSFLLASREFSFKSAKGQLFFDEIERLAPHPNFQPDGRGELVFLKDASSAESDSTSLAIVLDQLEAAADVVGLKFGSTDGQDSILSFPAAGPMEACLDRLMAVAGGAQLTFARNPSRDSMDQLLAACQATRVHLSPAELRTLTKQGWNGDRRVTILLRGGRLPGFLAREQDDRVPRYFKAAYFLLGEPKAGGYVAQQKLSNRSGTSGLLPILGKLSVQDQQGKPVPSGGFGQLYWNNTAVQFVARSIADGHLEALDRNDRFVQVRGHRVCLGEIDDALNLLPSVDDSFTIVREVHGEPSFTAYLAADGATSGKEALSPEAHLTATLPGHMVPAEYIRINKLPRRLDGRVDLAALPAMTAPAQTAPAMQTTSMTAVEEKLAGIWKDVLSLRQVDIHTPFFELGGSSLLLVRLFARINKAFETSLPITAIFDAKTIAALSMTLGGEAQISPLVQVQTSGSKPALFMIHSYLLYKGLSTSLGADQPFYGLRELDRDGHLTIEERVSRYVSEIRRVQPRGPYHLAGWCAAGPLTVEVARQLIQAGQEVHYIALFDSWLPGYLDSVEAPKTSRSRLPFREVSSKLSYHRRKMVGLKSGKKVRYIWMAATRVLKEARYHLYLQNWERLRRLSEKYQFALPQFMHNTSLDTFSALKDYRERRIPIRLTLIRASDSREVPGAAASCGWERVAEYGVDVLWAPGDHETMFVGANLEATASILRKGLESAGHSPLEEAVLPGGSSDLKSIHLGRAALHVDCPIL